MLCRCQNIFFVCSVEARISHRSWRTRELVNDFWANYPFRHSVWIVDQWRVNTGHQWPSKEFQARLHLRSQVALMALENCRKSMSTDQYCLIDIQKRFQLDAICERFYVPQLLISSFLLNDLQYIVVLQRTRKQHVEMKNLCNTVIFVIAKEPHSNTRILQKFFNELLDQWTLFKESLLSLKKFIVLRRFCWLADTLCCSKNLTLM